MLTLNIIPLIKNKTISIKYKIIPINNYLSKYIHNELNKNIIDIFTLLNLLSITYLYIYKYIFLKQKILLSTNHFQYIAILKSIATLTSTYYIYNNNISSGIFSNWILLKKKLLIYKWLRYFFITNLAVKNKYKNNIYIYHILYLLYIKLKVKYNGLKNLTVLPNTLIFLTLDDNKFLKETIKLKKNIILISNTNLINVLLPTNVIRIFTINKNFVIINFILEIITTAMLHGLLI